MRISCAVPHELCSANLVTKLKEMGLNPIVTTQIVRVVYEGSDHRLGTQIVLMFENELNHDITVDYCDERQERLENRRKLKKAEAWLINLPEGAA